MRRGAALALLSMAMLAVPASAKPPARPTARVDWARTFSVTPDGGYRMGKK